MTTDDQRELLTRDQAAELMGVQVRTIDRWADSGWITRYRVNINGVRFTREDLEKMRQPTPEK